jgi:hypothetical protein
MPPKEKKFSWSVCMGTLRKLILIPTSRRVEVSLFDLLRYRAANDNPVEKYTYPNGQSREKLPLEIASGLKFEWKISV